MSVPSFYSMTMFAEPDSDLKATVSHFDKWSAITLFGLISVLWVKRGQVEQLRDSLDQVLAEWPSGKNEATMPLVNGEPPVDKWLVTPDVDLAALEVDPPLLAHDQSSVESLDGTIVGSEE